MTPARQVAGMAFSFSTTEATRFSTQAEGGIFIRKKKKKKVNFECPKTVTHTQNEAQPSEYLPYSFECMSKENIALLPFAGLKFRVLNYMFAWFHGI